MQNQNQPTLKREIGTFSLALNAINIIIGGGIFVLPAVAAENLGSSAFIAYIICGLLIVLIMLCYAEVGSKVTVSGGSSAYVEKAFGPFPGFLINTLFWFAYAMLSDAALINVMTDMLAVWFPIFSVFYVRVIFFVVVFGMLTFINILGVKTGARFNNMVTLMKLVPLLLLVMIGLFFISGSNLSISSWPGIKSIGDTCLLLFFIFIGGETALNISGEIKNPQKTIPKGILLGVAGIVVIYLLTQFVAQGVMGSELLLDKKAPIASVATKLVGPIGGTIILVATVVSAFGLISGDMLLEPRLIYAASRNKLLPDFLGMIHPRFASPYWAIMMYALLAIIFSSTGGFEQLATLVSSASLIIYLAVVLAMIRLRFRKYDLEQGGFKVPFGLTVPILAMIVIGWLLSHVTIKEIRAMAIFFVILTVFYFINKALRQKINT
jgi:APA family basic amino acid/polyamine antiporter